MPTAVPLGERRRGRAKQESHTHYREQNGTSLHVNLPPVD
jgi:hypothetical protein